MSDFDFNAAMNLRFGHENSIHHTAGSNVAGFIPSWGLSMDDLVERDGLSHKKFTDVPLIVDIDDAKHVWFEVRNVDNDEYLETILYKAEDKSEIFDVLDGYDWRPS